MKIDTTIYATASVIMITLLILVIIALLYSTVILSTHKDAAVTEDARGKEAPVFVEMNVSAYCICEQCCSTKWADGITASGKPAVGLICAAPPEYAFGTIMVVEGTEYVVEDRGYAIQGNKLDLLMESHDLAKEFGRKTLIVEVKP